MCMICVRVCVCDVCENLCSWYVWYVWDCVWDVCDMCENVCYMWVCVQGVYECVRLWYMWEYACVICLLWCVWEYICVIHVRVCLCVICDMCETVGVWYILECGCVHGQLEDFQDSVLSFQHRIQRQNSGYRGICKNHSHPSFTNRLG